MSEQLRTLQDRLRGSRVKRWHTIDTVKTQNNAQHQFNVATIALYIKPDLSLEALKYCLYHDTAEFITGDIPHPAKKSRFIDYNRLKNNERYYLRLEQGLSLSELGDNDALVFMVADALDAYMFIRQEPDAYVNGEIMDIARDIFDRVSDIKTALKPNQILKLEKLIASLGTGGGLL